MPKLNAGIAHETATLDWAAEYNSLIKTKGGIEKLLSFAFAVVDMMATVAAGHDEYITISRSRSEGKPLITIKVDSSPLYADGWTLEELATNLQGLL
jgi:hypothetical protein